MWLRALPLVLLILVAGVVLVVLYGGARWQAGTEQLIAEMWAERAQPSIDTHDSREIADLPAPVERYFRTVLDDGQPWVTAVTVEHTGSFNMGEAEDQWRPFVSTQHVIPRRPGFLWDARIRMAPALTVCVHDGYVAGRGVLVAKLLGLVTVMEQPSTPELAQGELMRFLAEAAWYPTALLPRQGVRWEPIDETQATARLTDGETEVDLVFAFDAQGLINTVRSDTRYREVEGVQVATPWEGRFWDYERRDGMLIPLEGEVAWLLPEGRRAYWRGRTEAIEYEYVD